MSAPRASYVGRCLVRDDGTRLEALDLVTGARASLEGRLRAAWHEPASPLRDAALALCPDLRALDEAMRAETPTLAELLRGTGFGLLFVELTARCNERCTHCYADAAPERDEALSREQVVEVLRQGRALGFTSVQFTGGDPLLHPALLPLVDDARTLGYGEVELFTNGLALDAPLLDALAARGVALAFSVYSHDAAAHDAVTRTHASHARTLRAVGRSIAAGLRVRVATTRIEGIAFDEAALRAQLAALGLPASSLRITESRAVGRGTRTEGEAGAGHHGLSSKERSGKACVSSRGELFPCIFGRATPLGRLEGGLLAALSQPTAKLPEAASFARALERAEAQLACLECRIRAAALAPTTHLPLWPREAA